MCTDQTAITGTEFTIPYFYSYTNLATSTTVPTYTRSAINSLFASADIGYKDMLYLTVSAREDWFSVLNMKSNSIFYPAVGGTFIVSDAVQMPQAISFIVKLRGSWAQVGGATVAPYQISQSYTMVQGGHNGRPVQGLTATATGATVVPNPDLRPLTSTTYEGGFEARFLDNRLGLDLTLYNRKTTDDIVQGNIAISSGYSAALLNVGELSNKGIEVLITGTPVKAQERGKFGWDVSYNVAYNKSEVVKLAPGLANLTVGDGVGGGTIRNQVGGTYGEVWGYRKKTDANGNVIFNTASGYAVRGDLEKIGRGVPPLTMGITNSFAYKNFSLNVLIDGKFGSVVYSNLYQYAYRFGLPKETLPGRETGLTVTGVTPEGAAYSKTWAKEDIDTYYDNDKNYTSIFVFKNDFVKLRQIIFSYNLPVSKLSFLRLQSASISLVARNVAILYKDKRNKYFDPESGYTNGNAQGLEAFGVPRTRTIGVKPDGQILIIKRFTTMRKLSGLIFATAAAFVLAACDHGFEEMNVNPNASQEVTPGYVFTNAQLDAVSVNYVGGAYLTIGGSMQHFATYKEMPAAGDKYFNYNYSTGNWNAYAGVDLTGTTGAVIEIEQVIDAVSEDPADVNKLAVARIWRAYIFHRLTDLYGDIPYSQAGEALTRKNYTPTYDKQADIYADMFKELEEAINSFDASKRTFATADLIYGGDINKWKKFGYSLMLRLGMHLSSRAATEALAQTWVEKAIAGGSLITEDAEHCFHRLC